MRLPPRLLLVFMPSSQQGHDDTPPPIFCVQHQEHCSSGPSYSAVLAGLITH